MEPDSEIGIVAVARTNRVVMRPSRRFEHELARLEGERVLSRDPAATSPREAWREHRRNVADERKALED